MDSFYTDEPDYRNPYRVKRRTEGEGKHWAATLLALGTIAAITFGSFHQLPKAEGESIVFAVRR